MQVGLKRKIILIHNKRNNPYSFDLLYRASRDGNTAVVTFHEKCDNKGPTIVIAKIANSEQIVGGYNPFQWDSSGYKATKDSFIFSFTNRNNIQTAKVSYPNDGYYNTSINCYSNYGPTFGGGFDLICYNNGSWTSNNPYTYPKIDVPKSFYTDDYEVFQVIK